MLTNLLSVDHTGTTKMFSFLSSWRQASSSSDGDSDVSSLNKSLNLPWPVTESSPRKSKKEGTPTQQPVMNTKEISRPMPKMALKSLTRPDDHHPAAAGLPSPSIPPTSLHPSMTAPTPTTPQPVAWFQESAARRKKNNYNLRTALLQANARAQHISMSNANAPPQVVRLDSNDGPPTTTTHHDLYAATTTHPYANGTLNSGSLYANQYASPPPHAHQSPHDEDNEGDDDDDDDEDEIYASPFGHSDHDEDDFFQGLPPDQATTTTTTTTTTPRWGGLKLQTASPFSQSTLRVDGLTFPSPPDTTFHHHLPLPSATGVFPLPPQSGTSLSSPSSSSSSLPLPTVNTDVYNHAYNYPLAKQLSPIAEQDYFSPISVRALPGSAASASPGAESVLHFGPGNGKERMTTAEGDKEKERDWERGSVRTRSGRAGSVGSTKAPAMTSVSRSGSLSMREGATTAIRDPNSSPSGSTVGSEIARKYLFFFSFPFYRPIKLLMIYTLSYRSVTDIRITVYKPSSEPNVIADIF